MSRKQGSIAILGLIAVVGLTMGIIRMVRTGAQQTAPAAAAPSGATVDVTVNEGTSMSVAVSPDGRTLAIDLQGSIWTLPATGGPAKRITDVFNDARQPMWSPDGRTIAFFAYRDGGYDLWAIAPDGTNQRKLTWGAYDDREPIWSHDGTHLAFSSDRREWASRTVGDYNIWVLNVGTGELRQLTTDPAEDFMPTWSPDDKEIAFVSQRGAQPAGAGGPGGGGGGAGARPQALWAVSLSSGAERKLPVMARADAPSWGPGGQIVYHTTAQGQSQLEADGKPLTGTENAFPFRVSWASPTDFYYTSDGKIRKRAVGGGDPQTVEFTATLQATPARYTQRRRDFDSTAPRQAAGIVRPVISPDGTKVAFAALNDIYVMPISSPTSPDGASSGTSGGAVTGGTPENITKDQAFDTDPAWSPDGSQLAYSSDKGGDQLQIWIRDMKTGQSRQLTKMDTQPQGAAWSPDGTRIAVFNVTGMWRVAEFSVIDVATGTVTKVHDTLPQPGGPTWSPDGQRLAIAAIAPYSTRFREGTNQVLTMSAAAPGDDKWYTPIPMLAIDSRGGCGPVWSPDGSKMAAIYEGVLSVWPVAPTGEPLGPPRHVTTESANSPSWQGDSKHLLYLNYDKLKIVNVETGEIREVPMNLKYTVDMPTTRLLVHASRLVDGKSETARTDVDILIEGNRIRSVEPHADSRHGGGVTVVDGTNLTAMPGLIEWHSHLQPDFGEAQGRAWLAFGITGVRSPGGIPYEAAEEREASDANLRPGPRVFSTGHLLEYQRVYYKMGMAISTPAHLEMELQRYKALQLDMIKSYVRMTDLQQRRIIEYAHSIGIPVSTHEIFPAAMVSMDGTEHTSGTSRRGYSPKIGTMQRSYADVTQLLGKAQMVFCPMLSGSGTQRIYQTDPAMRQDPRFGLYPQWMQRQVTGQGGGGGGFGGGDGGGQNKMLIDAYKAGSKIVVGTDSPNAFQTHGSLMGYVLAGMTPFEALRAATLTPAEALGIDAGSVEAGKLADIVIVDGNPLEDIGNTRKVRRVIKNGRVYELEDLIKGATRTPISTASAQ